LDILYAICYVGFPIVAYIVLYADIREERKKNRERYMQIIVDNTSAMNKNAEATRNLNHLITALIGRKE